MFDAKMLDEAAERSVAFPALGYFTEVYFFDFVGGSSGSFVFL